MNLLVFLEGLAAFVSPCILPMLPVYLVYLGGKPDGQGNKKLIVNTLGFILGFTIVFTLMGVTASAIASILNSNKILLQRISGVIMIIFGLHYMGILKIGFLNREKRMDAKTDALGFFSSVLFGMAFSLGWTPCIGLLLGSALLLAANSDTLWEGTLMLLLFSLGLGIPYLLTALIFEKTRSLFGFMKKHFRVISMASGILLISVGILLFFDIFGYWQSIFN